MMTSNTINLARGDSTFTPLQSDLFSLLLEGPRTRDELVARLHVPRTTIYDALKAMMRSGEVTRYPRFDEGRGRGRPVVLFAIQDGSDDASLAGLTDGERDVVLALRTGGMTAEGLAIATSRSITSIYHATNVLRLRGMIRVSEHPNHNYRFELME